MVSAAPALGLVQHMQQHRYQIVNCSCGWAVEDPQKAGPRREQHDWHVALEFARVTNLS